MKRAILSILILCVLSLAACEKLETPPASSTNNGENQVVLPLDTGKIQETPSSSSTAGDQSKSNAQVKVEYAKNFSLEYGNGYKKLTVLQPWANADQAYTYILIPRGSQVPADAGSAMVIETPIRSIVTMSSTYFPFLENIGELGTLKGVDDATYVYNSSVRDMAESGSIAIIGGGAGGGAVDLEKLVQLKPDLVMTSASGSPDIDVHPKLLEAGLSVVINADYLENSPLGRAEWGKFIAAFYDKEELAGQLFDEMVARYNAVKELTAAQSAKPSVFTNTDYQGTWYVAGGESYAALLLQDAGANYLWADQPGTGASPLSFEEVFAKAKNADYWLNVGFANDLNSLVGMDARYAEFKAFKDQYVYNYNKRMNPSGGVDYYESGVANPDVVLKDLVKIFYPDLLPGYELFYYQQLN